MELQAEAPPAMNRRKLVKIFGYPKRFCLANFSGVYKIGYPGYVRSSELSFYHVVLNVFSRRKSISCLERYESNCVW